MRRRERGGRRVVQVSSTVGAIDALRSRIKAQSKAVAAHIAADPEAQSFIAERANRFSPRFSPARAQQTQACCGGPGHRAVRSHLPRCSRGADDWRSFPGHCRFDSRPRAHRQQWLHESELSAPPEPHLHLQDPYATVTASAITPAELQQLRQLIVLAIGGL